LEYLIKCILKKVTMDRLGLKPGVMAENDKMFAIASE
jgi:hypothetical protein